MSPLRRARLRRGLTLAALSAKCRAEGATVSIAQLSRLERGKYEPRPALRSTLARVLGLDVDLTTSLEKQP